MHSANKQGPAPKTAATGGSGEHALAQSANPHGYGDRIYPVYKIAIIVDCLADEGTSPTDALKGTGLGVNEVHSPSTRTSLAQLLRVYGNALKLARSPAFALSTGAHIHVTYYGMYGYALLSSPTVQEALDFAVKYHELATPMVRQSFAQQGHRGVWTMEPTLPILVDDGLYRFVTEFQIGTHLALHREVISPEFQPTEVRLRFREPADLASYRQICDCVRFGQDSNQFMFDAKWLSRRPEAANLITYASARDLCSEMLAQMDQATGTAGAVRHWLLRMPGQSPGLEAVAKALGMSPRTLKRRLETQGTSFHRIATEVRMEVALKYLRETSIPTDEIAARIGYSDAANFRHAFKRWTGKTPAEARTTSEGLPY